MRNFSHLWLVLAAQLLAGCESLHMPWQQPAPASSASAVAGEPGRTSAPGVQCPAQEPVVCAEPEVKVVERVIERTHEKIVEVPVAKDKLVLGAVERFAIEPGGVILDSLIDTGAATSSLNAQELTHFERDGKEWVRFLLPPGGGGENRVVSIELPVKRYVRVARPGFDRQRRPIVDLSLNVGQVTHMVEVNLTDRSDANYPLLVGRNFLKDSAVVDVSRRHVQGTPQLPESK
ncbi:ATP-dependent zinc protease [Microbulbifer sp. TYP-18]|uniref:ATP-dependent zinc protease n=1 Tax=Microbulbifer sp. TYP-18 TaxID=3230024 RepID=UPI0034C5FC4B